MSPRAPLIPEREPALQRGVPKRPRCVPAPHRVSALPRLWGELMRKAIVVTMLALGAIAALARAPAAAAEMQPGLWRFTQTTTGASGRPRKAGTTRCVRPAEAADPVRYFALRSCELIENSSFGSRISSRMRCTAGQTTATSSPRSRSTARRA